MEERKATDKNLKLQDINLLEKRKHGDVGFPMRVYWNDFTTYVAESIPWHWHEEMEFAIITEGSVEVSVGTGSLLLQKGEAIFINTDTLHQMKPQGEKKAYMFTIVAHPCILGIEKGFLLSTKYVAPFITNDNIKMHIFRPEVDWQREAIDKLQQIYDSFEEKGYGYEYKLHNLLCEVWFSMVEHSWSTQIEEVSYKAIDETRIYQALEYIQTHYMEAISLEDICDHLNISKSECCRCFKRNIRMTPFEYLMIHRVSTAAKLLEKTNQSITEIAIGTGFNSNSYFCKIFKKYMSVSPAEYRKNGRKEGI